jgi:hypothetical protein
MKSMSQPLPHIFLKKWNIILLFSCSFEKLTREAMATIGCRQHEPWNPGVWRGLWQHRQAQEHAMAKKAQFDSALNRLEVRNTMKKTWREKILGSSLLTSKGRSIWLKLYISLMMLFPSSFFLSFRRSELKNRTPCFFFFLSFITSFSFSVYIHSSHFHSFYLFAFIETFFLSNEIHSFYEEKKLATAFLLCKRTRSWIWAKWAIIFFNYF